MTTLEVELRNALTYRAEMLLGVATSCAAIAIVPAVASFGGSHPGFELAMLESNVATLRYVEALSAAIYVRSGVSWDTLAAPMDVSRQALHQRLAARGDRAFSAAQRHVGISEARVPEETNTLVAYAMRLDKIALEAQADAAARLIEARRQRRWWADGRRA